MLDLTLTVARIKAKNHYLLLLSQLKTYEADFNSENQEKEKIQKRLNESGQESERLRRENQSHMATIRHFESEVRNTLFAAFSCRVSHFFTIQEILQATAFIPFTIFCFFHLRPVLRSPFRLNGG